MDKVLKEKFFDPFMWNESVNQYSTSQEIPLMKGSNGYVATNLGDTVVVVNGKTLFPSSTPATSAGDSVSAIGNLGELYKGNKIRIQFANPAGATPLVEIMEKFYIGFE